MAIARRSKYDLMQEIVSLVPWRSKADLVLMSKQQLVEILMGLKAPANVLPQFDVMLAASSERYMDLETLNPWYSSNMQSIWRNPKLRVEQKLDGVRAKIHFTVVDGQRVVRVDGRNKSTATFAFSEFTENLPQFTRWPYWTSDLFESGPDGVGSILDGELLMPAESIWTGKVQTDSVRYSSIVITNAGSGVAIQVQRDNGWCRYYLFDILMYKGRFVTNQSLWDRLIMLDIIRQTNPHPAFESVAFLAHDSPADAKVKFYLSIVEAGGEGVVLKDIEAPYELGKRRESWLKVKKFETIDCFVNGFRPGDHGFEGMVGAIEGAVYKDGNIFGVCAVSGFTLEERKAMTDELGELKDSYYNRVMEVRFQETSKTGRGMHARFVRWRSDKRAEECVTDI